MSNLLEAPLVPAWDPYTHVGPRLQPLSRGRTAPALVPPTFGTGNSGSGVRPGLATSFAGTTSGGTRRGAQPVRGARFKVDPGTSWCGAGTPGEAAVQLCPGRPRGGWAGPSSTSAHKPGRKAARMAHKAQATLSPDQEHRRMGVTGSPKTS